MHIGLAFPYSWRAVSHQVALIRCHVGHDAVRSIRTDRPSRLAAVVHQLMRLSAEGSVRFGESRVMIRQLLCSSSQLLRLLRGAQPAQARSFGDALRSSRDPLSPQTLPDRRMVLSRFLTEPGKTSQP